MIEPIEFPSQDALLRGLLLRPAGAREAPIVIMAHGTSATITMVVDRYAEVFCRSGLAVLLYDHRNFGRSGGEPRQEINPWIQCRGYLDAASFAARLPGIDPDRIALWGDSYSGAEVIVAGAIDRRVSAIVAQCPACGAAPPPIAPSRAAFEQLEATLLCGDVAGVGATTTGPVPVVSSDQAGSPSLLAPIQAFRWFVDYGGRPGTGWINSATRVIPATPVPFHAALCAPHLRAQLLMMVAPEDEMVHANYAVARATYDLVPGPKHWYDIAGGHFGLLYYPSERFDEASSAQARFLASALGLAHGQAPTEYAV